MSVPDVASVAGRARSVAQNVPGEDYHAFEILIPQFLRSQGIPSLQGDNPIHNGVAGTHVTTLHCVSESLSPSASSFHDKKRAERVKQEKKKIVAHEALKKGDRPRWAKQPPDRSGFGAWPLWLPFF